MLQDISVKNIKTFLLPIFTLIIIGSACQPAADTTSNANVSNTNTIASNTNTAAPLDTDPGPAIQTKEPETYSATFVVSAETTGGEKTIGIPTISTEVARSGADRRVAFKLPNGEQIIYLDRADKRYVIAPSRKQYTEVTPELTGFDVPRMMTPGQIVAYLEKLRGYERVGEEQLGGRTAIKYRYVGVAKTSTQAGDVKSETYVFVDKDTSLPLKSEIFSEASGDVQGIKGARIIAEMKDLKTDVDKSIFEVPQGFNKVSAEQIKQQVGALMAIVGAVLQNMNAQSAPASSPSSANTSPSPSSAH
jgi:hypothetical protein